MSADQTDKIYIETSLRVPIEFVVIYVEIFSLEWVVVDVEKLTWRLEVLTSSTSSLLLIKFIDFFFMFIHSKIVITMHLRVFFFFFLFEIF